MEKFGGSIERIPPGPAFQIPSAIQARPKFAPLDELENLANNPDENPDINTVLTKMSQVYRYQAMAQKCAAAITRPGQSISFQQSPGDFVVVHLPRGMPRNKVVVLSPEKELSFVGTHDSPVFVDQFRNNKLRATYRCDFLSLHFSDEEYPTPHTSGMLELHGNPVMRKDLLLNTPEIGADSVVVLQPLVIPESYMVAPVVMKVETMTALSNSGQFTPGVTGMMQDVKLKISELFRLIKSEKHSRGSFAVSCLPLVLLGAALGILLRRRNPLAVFVVGFVPAILLVLLITAGRRMVEWSDHNATQGYMIIWAGNAILLGLVVSVYWKLLRQ